MELKITLTEEQVEAITWARELYNKGDRYQQGCPFFESNKHFIWWVTENIIATRKYSDVMRWVEGRDFEPELGEPLSMLLAYYNEDYAAPDC